MKKLIFLLYFLSFSAFGVGQLTTVQNGIKLYSEYYPNPTAKFKGTIVFINGSGTSRSEWGQKKIFPMREKRRLIVSL